MFAVDYGLLILVLYKTMKGVTIKIETITTNTKQYHVSGYANLIQRPSLWIIDLNTDKRIRRYEIPDTVVKEGHGMISLRIDVDKDKCDGAFAYICDYLNQKIYVYRYVYWSKILNKSKTKYFSFEKNRMWAHRHVYFNNELKYGKYNIDGFKFEWFDGVFSVALARRSTDGYRKAFFHPMARYC